MTFRQMLKPPRLRTIATACALLVLPMHVGAQRVAISRQDSTVLFVCEHGTVKSLLAKLLFDQYAGEVGLPMRAISRGTAVDSTVPPWMQAALTADHLVVGTFRPLALQASDLTRATFVVSFDVPSAATASATAPRAQWDGLPSVSQNYSAGRDAIRMRVKQLVDSLKRAQSTRR